MREYLIIDGYNIINDWPSLKAMCSENIEAARDKLIEIMTGFRSYKGIEVIIVFDGHLVKDNPGSSINMNGVKVIYTREQETADSFIEKAVAQLAKKALVRVATSDWAEQQVVLALGGIRVSAGELKGLVEDCQRDMKRKFVEKNKDSINTVNGSLSPEVARKLQKWRKAP
ncbi:MAG: NYN domain-containing protein [Bacillota bacterium]|nr:NYN domain-containing protein [Bacillota bacterium]MDD3297766.1 NYN domain-containing protein [Bacillota bacterium]MDD3851936.1 NYN domain-containing protein [Bacillota bacterium]MDD4706661.1 NYN domain-containing protein [Bacillota bacterium]